MSPTAQANTNTEIWLAGAFAALSVDILVYPLDTLKTRLQSPDYRRRYLSNATNTRKLLANPAMYRGLYQGVSSAIVATLPSSGAFFITYEAIKSSLSPIAADGNSSSSSSNIVNNNNKINNLPLLPQPIIHASASALAELVSCAILTPAEVIKQNAQVIVTTTDKNRSKTKGSLSATAQTISRFRSRPTELWRGYTALAGRNLPFTALQFPLLERFRDGLTEWRDRQQRSRKNNEEESQSRNDDNDINSQISSSFTASSSPSLSMSASVSPAIERAVITAVSAGTAGAIAAIVTTPVDVVKTRIMLAAAAAADSTSDTSAAAAAAKNRSTAKSGLAGKSKGGFAIARDILVTEGIRGLWRGGALRAVWTMVGSGLYLGVYEGGRVWLAGRRRLEEDVDVS